MSSPPEEQAYHPSGAAVTPDMAASTEDGMRGGQNELGATSAQACDLDVPEDRGEGVLHAVAPDPFVLVDGELQL